MNEIILYSTGCPRCSVLKKKLDANNIDYHEVTDVDQMTKLGIDAVPVLNVGNKYLDFSQAIKWINESE